MKLLNLLDVLIIVVTVFIKIVLINGSKPVVNAQCVE